MAVELLPLKVGGFLDYEVQMPLIPLGAYTGHQRLLHCRH